MDKYDHLFKIQAVFQNSISVQSVQLSTRYIQAAIQAIMIDFFKQNTSTYIHIMNLISLQSIPFGQLYINSTEENSKRGIPKIL